MHLEDSQCEQWCGSNPVTIEIGQKIIILLAEKNGRISLGLIAES